MLQSKHSEAFLAVAETGSFEQAGYSFEHHSVSGNITFANFGKTTWTSPDHSRKTMQSHSSRPGSVTFSTTSSLDGTEFNSESSRTKFTITIF